MINYRIGLVEDDANQANSIKRVFYRYGKFNDCSFDIKNYFIENDNLALQKIIENIFDAMKNDDRDCFIIDYKLNLANGTNKGIEILTKIKETVAEFPCIMLTVRPDECMDEVKVDPDKIYMKSIFLKIGEIESDYLVKKVLMNINRVQKEKSRLQQGIDDIRRQIIAGNVEDENSQIEKIIQLEAALDQYALVGQSELDKIYNASELESIVQLIQKAKGLIG